MKMKRKRDNFLEILWGAYLDQKNEHISIEEDILKRNDLDINELEKIICPILKEEGFLKSFPPNIVPAESSDPIILVSDLDTSQEIYKSIYWFVVNNEKLKEKFDSGEKITLYLSERDRNLFLDLEKEPYTMSKKEFSLLNLIKNKKSYTKTEDIREEINSKSVDSVYKIKSEINSSAIHFFKIEDDLVMNSQNYGYKINPKYRIENKR